MNSRYITIFSIAAAVTFAQAPAPELQLQQARAIVLADRAQAETVLRQAIAQWDAKKVQPDEYVAATLLLGMVLYPARAKDKAALESDVEPLARKALELRERNPDTKAADLALALEFDALVLDAMGREEDARAPKAKAREIRDVFIAALQPPADDIARPYQLGSPELTRPAFLVHVEAKRTFEARVLMLKPSVEAEFVIGVDGRMRQVELWRPAGFGLDEEMTKAMVQWRFRPAMRNGQPVPAASHSRFDFAP